MQMRCCDFFNVKNSRLKLQTTGRKTFAMHITKGNAHYSEYVRTFLQISRKILNRLLTKKNIQMTSKHKKCAHSLSGKSKLKPQ